MPAGSTLSDTATFSNVDPQTSEAEALGGTGTQLIWGTNVSVNDALFAAKDFLRNFQNKYRLIQDGELESSSHLPADHPGNAKQYVEIMNTMLELSVDNLNLDCRNLKSYPPTRKLWHQMQAFPNEIIPIVDLAVKDVMIELAEKRMNELRVQASQQAQRDAHTRDSSSMPRIPSSDAPNVQTARPNGAASGLTDIHDIVREVEGKIYKVRPFGLDQTINLRELNPGGMV